MSMHPDQGFPPTMPPPSGMSGTTKLLLGCGLLGGLALLVCCGIAGFGYYKFKDAFIVDPVKVQELSTTIAEIDVPAEFTPIFGMNMNLGVKMKFVVYQGGNEQQMLMLGEFSGGDTQDPDAMAAEMKKGMAQQGKGEGEQIIAEETIEHKVTIRGQESTFQIIKGKGSNSGKAMWQATGTFPGKEAGSTGLVIIALDGEKYTEEQVKEIVDSIK